MKGDTKPRPLQDVLVALVLLTRLPLPGLPDAAFASAARAVWAYPLAGVAVGGLATLAGLAALAADLPVAMAAGLALGAGMVLTGAMHEDGLADVTDGFWGGQEPARRLEIMRDSRIGAFGTLALVLSCGLRWAAFAALLVAAPAAIIACAAVSRGVMPVLMLALPHARSDGLSRSVGSPGAAPVLLGLALAVAVAIICAGAAGLAGFVASLVATAGVGLLARARIGGQTGDVLGATQQVAEITALAVLVIGLT